MPDPASPDHPTLVRKSLLRETGRNFGGLLARLLPAPLVVPASFFVRESTKKSTLALNAVGIAVALAAGQLAQKVAPVPSMGVILETYTALCAGLAGVGGVAAALWRRRR